MPKKTPSKEEKRHMSRVAAFCIICRNLGYEDTQAEVHHLRTGMGMGQRNNHYNTIGLCVKHHRIGPEAIHHMGTRAWCRKFGTELELLEQVRLELGE